MRKIPLLCMLLTLALLVVGCTAAKDAALPTNAPTDVPTDAPSPEAPSSPPEASLEPEASLVPDTPAQAAFVPSFLVGITEARLTYTAMPVQAEEGVNGTFEQALTDAEGLELLSIWLSQAVPVEGPACPFEYASLSLTTAEGHTFMLQLATDSCTIYKVGEAYYNYLPATYRDAYDSRPDNRLLFDLFPEIPLPVW